MLDRLAPEEMAPETAESWIIALDATLARGDEQALAERFVPGSHWRSLLGVSWLFATFSGRKHLASQLVPRAREAHAEGLGPNTARLAPRRPIADDARQANHRHDGRCAADARSPRTQRSPP